MSIRHFEQDAPDQPGSGGRARFGISAALVTPFSKDGAVDVASLARHHARVLASGAVGGTLFGTTGEGASLSLAERLSTLAGLIECGVQPSSLVVCVPASSVHEATAQIGDAQRHGVETVLLPPPHYFKDVPEDGVFAWYRAVFEGVASERLKVILYHIPQVTGVPLSLDLVRRLAEAHPDLIYGVKDSAGVFDDTRRLVTETDLAVLVGDERHLAAAARLGASGSISGMANVFAGRLAHVLATGEADPELDDLVDAVVSQPVVPAVKALVAHRTGDGSWLKVRPPLVEAAPERARSLAVRMDALQRDDAA